MGTLCAPMAISQEDWLADFSTPGVPHQASPLACHLCGGAAVAAVPHIEKYERVVLSVCPSVVEIFLCLMLLPCAGDHSKGLITHDYPPPLLEASWNSKKIV